jgi:adenine deaminase
VTLVRRSDGRVEFLVRENLQDADEEIAEKGDETVILCTDDCTIYDDIDEYDAIDAHLAITHDDKYVIGDAHATAVRTAIASFASGWRSSEMSRRIIFRDISTFSASC